VSALLHAHVHLLLALGVIGNTVAIFFILATLRARKREWRTGWSRPFLSPPRSAEEAAAMAAFRERLFGATGGEAGEARRWEGYLRTLRADVPPVSEGDAQSASERSGSPHG
jgi:hypothetical protein